MPKLRPIPAATVIRDYQDFVAAVVAARQRAGMKQLDMDARAGLPDGYTGKLEIGAKFQRAQCPRDREAEPAPRARSAGRGPRHGAEGHDRKPGAHAAGRAGAPRHGRRHAEHDARAAPGKGQEGGAGAVGENRSRCRSGGFCFP